MNERRKKREAKRGVSLRDQGTREVWSIEELVMGQGEMINLGEGRRYNSMSGGRYMIKVRGMREGWKKSSDRGKLR